MSYRGGVGAFNRRIRGLALDERLSRVVDELFPSERKLVQATRAKRLVPTLAVNDERLLVAPRWRGHPAGVRSFRGASPKAVLGNHSRRPCSSSAVTYEPPNPPVSSRCFNTLRVRPSELVRFVAQTTLSNDASTCDTGTLQTSGRGRDCDNVGPTRRQSTYRRQVERRYPRRCRLIFQCRGDASGRLIFVNDTSPRFNFISHRAAIAAGWTVLPKRRLIS